MRRDIPIGVRQFFGGQRVFVQTTGETDDRKAEVVADRLWRHWGEQIAEARLSASGGLEAVTTAIANWRRDACAAAAGLPARTLADMLAAARGITLPPGLRMQTGPTRLTLDAPAPRPAPSIESGAAAWARSYFEDHPDTPRTLDMPLPVGLLMGRLQRAAREAEGWADIEGFDDALDAAVALGGGPGTMSGSVRERVRQPFAVAWLEVVQHREAERRRAAAFLTALEAANASPQAIRVAGGPAAFVAREGDKTIGEVVALYRADREARYGAKDTGQKYSHIFRAILEAADKDKPMRAFTKEDARAVRDLLAKVPANASKLFRGKTLAEAAALGAAEDAANVEAAKLAESEGRAFKPKRKINLLARNTLRHYLANLNAVCNWAETDGYADKNPVKGLIPERRNNVKRRAYTAAELQQVFGGLSAERAGNAARFWVPAVLLYSGARANEIAQLGTADVKTTEGVPYLDLTWFDKSGVRVEDRRLKNAGSERAVPIHPELIAAGFLDFVAARRAEGAERLFPELTRGKDGKYTHELSKWFGNHLDSVGLPEPALVLHGFRHGFREAGRAARIPEDIINALGGWSAKGQGAGYGDRNSVGVVADNAAHLALIRIAGGFSLGPPPQRGDTLAESRPQELAA